MFVLGTIMHRFLLKVFLIASVAFSVNLLAEIAVFAEDNDAIAPANQPGLEKLPQKRQVVQIDWESIALKSFIQKSNCLADYPILNFTNNETTDRYEFARVLNACFFGLTKVIRTGDPSRLIRDNLNTLRRLRDEFALELKDLSDESSVYALNQNKLRIRLFAAAIGDNQTLNPYFLRAWQLISPKTYWNEKTTSEYVQLMRLVVSKYGCLPESSGSFYEFAASDQRKTQPLTRFESVEILYICLDKINELISSGWADKVTVDDLKILQKLQIEFQSELALYYPAHQGQERVTLNDYLEGNKGL
jgi:hypothetical protein